MAKVPKTITESEPITELKKVVEPVGTKDKAGLQINPAQEDGNLATLALRLNITLSALRDALCDATTPKDLLDIFNQLAVTLARNTSQWGGIALTGRDITADIARLNITLSALRDAVCDATTPKDLLDIFNQLAVTLNRNTASWGGVALTGRDISIDFAKLDIALSALRDALRGTGVKDFTTLEADIETILARLDVALSTRATEATLSTRATETTLAARASEATLAASRDLLLNVFAQLLGADETLSQSITLDTAGRTLLDIYTIAAAATTFRLDVSNDNTNWITDYLTWAAVASVKETHTNAFRYLRLKSDAAGVAGNLVSLYLTGAR